MPIDLNIQQALAAVLTWAFTGLTRWLWPTLWDDLDTERVRLAFVALVGLGFSVVAGVAQGLGFWQIVQMAFAALSGSVLLRRVTRSSDGGPDLREAARRMRRDRGIQTGQPQPPSPMT